MTEPSLKKQYEICRTLPRLLIWCAVLPVFFLWQEAIVRIFLYGSFHWSYLTYILPFSIALGFALTGLFSFIPPLGERIAHIAVMAIMSVVYGVHFIYFRFFSNFFTWEMMGNGEALSDFWRETLKTILKNWYVLILIFAPLVLYCVFSRRIMEGKRTALVMRCTVFMVALAAALCCLLYIRSDLDPYGNQYVHGSGFTMSEGVDRFGLTDATFTDLRYRLFGRPDDSSAILDPSIDGTTLNPDDIFAWNEVTTSPPETTLPPDSTETGEIQPPPPPPDTSPNVLDVDFDALIAAAKTTELKDMHRYFASIEPTKKNEYTGYFAGKNIIYITAEGFCPQFITKELTPTLYQMMYGGFYLENFYNSVWGGSTATGEYSNVTGLFYCYGSGSYGAGQVWNAVGDMNVYLPFTIGNELKSRGYTSYAFHNHNYAYYGRDKSHPLLGYEYLGVGNGLKGLSAGWPASDLEMAKITAPYYIDSEHFSIYYMTVSGHGYYDVKSNAQSRKNYDRVKHLPYSEEVKAYIASQLEVEDMLTYLCNELEARGKLKDTVFVLAADHYPYALSADAQKELFGISETNNLDAEFELYRNAGIIWCASMEEPVVISSPCSTIDLLPTVLNLFGLPYDSRLLAGTDLLSDTEPLVILNQNGRGSMWNWINRYGSYNSRTHKFTPAEGVEVDESLIDSYVESVNRSISFKRKYIPKILYTNYFQYFSDAVNAALAAETATPESTDTSVTINTAGENTMP